VEELNRLLALVKNLRKTEELQLEETEKPKEKWRLKGYISALDWVEVEIENLLSPSQE
jgi:hypothetical protein